MSKNDQLITITLINQVPYIWKAEDAVFAREENHIVGTLVGCLPRLPRQNIHLGLPLQLLQEEAKLLVEKKLALLVDDSVPVEVPSKEGVGQFQNTRKKLYKEQTSLFKEQHKKEMLSRSDEIIKGKKLKRNKLLEAKKKAGEHVSDSEFEKDVEFSVNEIKIEPVAEKHSLIQICTATPNKENSKIVELDFPSSDSENLRYAVFKDLWEQGYFLTTGGKFGGDFLVYPGDPSRFHSFFIAVCLPHEGEVTGLDLISLGRLGSSVRKTVLLCSRDKSGTLNYTSLQWTGIS